jgi:hypothetical protein
MSVRERIDRLDVSLFEQMPMDATSPQDRRSLLALHAAVAARGDFSYLEIGSLVGTHMPSCLADPRCREVLLVSGRNEMSGDEKLQQDPDTTTALLRERLAGLRGADFEKLTTFGDGTERLDPTQLTADICFIDARGTDDSALRNARFCRRVLRNRGVIVFHHRTRVGRGIRRFLGDLSRYRAYPLAHELFVVEMNVPSLLLDPRVKAQLTRKTWLVADRLRVVRASLLFGAVVGRLRTSMTQTAPLHVVVRARLRARLPARRPRFYLAVCAIFRDEAPYLAEWIEFHRLQGVEHFWLYDNLSGDDWRSAITPNSDVVDVTPWPVENAGQYSAYLDCLTSHRRDARWIAFIDIDEFLFSPAGRSLPKVLREFEQHPGVVANWRMYGTNGYEDPPEGLVIENYLMRGPDDHPDNVLVKSIINPRKAVDFVDDPHRFHLVGTPVGEDHRPNRSALRDPATTDLLRINHYYSRSARELARKRARANAADGLVRDTAQTPQDEIRDETILQYLPALKAEMQDFSRRRNPIGGA